MEIPKPAPLRIGKYDVDRVLGRGVLGEVYLARDPILERQVAIRMIRGESHDRILQEARNLARLRHPNIVYLHDVGEHDGAPYLVMEYLEGRSLQSIVESGDRTPPGVLLRIMTTIAGALQAIHAAGIVHRDVKCENIVVSPEGEPTLVGFALSASASPSASQAGDLPLGSPRYMAPEQARGEPASPRSDLWSFGMTLYYILAQHRMYAGLSAAEIHERLLSPTPVDLAPLRARAPSYVVDVVERCLRKEPSERVASADELMRALEAATACMDASGSDTIAMRLPEQGQTLLLHVEYQESDLPGEYRQYDIREYVGAGTFGQVYRAQEKFTGKDVALKVLKPEWVSNVDAVARFRREAVFQARLSHPNIVRVYNFGRYGTSFFIAMEYFAGETLDRIKDARAPMSPGAACGFVVPILQALSAVHRAGGVHRDLKPANVAAMQDRVLIFDFGLARVEDMRQVTSPGTFLGTASYASPEHVLDRQTTSASDIYSAGAILYELLTGRLPHEADNATALFHKIASEPQVPITARRDDLPESLVFAVERMLAREPALRPSAEQAASLLETFVEA